MFWGEDAKIILALPVHEDRPNKLPWNFDPKGFSACGALTKFVGQTMRDRNGCGGQSSGGMTDVSERNQAFSLETCLEQAPFEKDLGAKKDED